MRKRRLWLCLLVVFLLGAAGLAAFLEPTRTVRGFLAGEAFYRGRPASYWREVLRKQGSSGSIPNATANQFWDGHAAFPVLRACAHDPDRDVRWPAIALLAKGNLRSQQVLEVLLEALDDMDTGVRLEAIRVLAGWGPMARPAIPALTARLQDQELQVAYYADLALWEIDTAAAVSACGWRSFTSPEYGFSVMLPVAQPEQEDRPVLGGLVVGHCFEEGHRAGPYEAPTRYSVLVALSQVGGWGGGQSRRLGAEGSALLSGVSGRACAAQGPGLTAGELSAGVHCPVQRS
jgi:hypothetical protein